MAKISKTHHVTKDGIVKKNPKKGNGWVRYTPEEFRDMGHNNVRGYVVEYNPPLYVSVFPKVENGSAMFPVGNSKTPIGKFQVVEGGFGSSFHTMGRMVIGKFYESLEKVEKGEPVKFGPQYEASESTKEGFSYVWVKNGKPAKKVD